MKTLVTIKSFALLNLVLFLSISTIANPVTSSTGDGVKSGVKKQITASGIANASNTKTAGTEFNYLRFDVNNYTSETSIVDLPTETMDYLRFDVNKFIDANEFIINELPAMSDFGYLRFDVNEFIKSSNEDYTEMPENEFDYLRFDVMEYTGSASGSMTELPLN